MSGPKDPHPSRQELWEGIFLSGGHLGGGGLLRIRRDWSGTREEGKRRSAYGRQ
jgi:hypothetical protein